MEVLSILQAVAIMCFGSCVFLCVRAATATDQLLHDRVWLDPTLSCVSGLLLCVGFCCQRALQKPRKAFAGKTARKQIAAFSLTSHHMLSSVWHLPTLNEEETQV